jgi:hypothetical protein
VDNEDYGRTNKLYHRIDTGDMRPICQPPRRLPLGKQPEISEMLDDMQRREAIEESDSPWFAPRRSGKDVEWQSRCDLKVTRNGY